MDLGTFIATLFCLIDDRHQHLGPRLLAAPARWFRDVW